MNRLEPINSRTTFYISARSLCSLCTLVVLLTAAVLSAACSSSSSRVSETPLVITGNNQCDNESMKGNLAKHKTLVAEGIILRISPDAGTIVHERNTVTQQTRTRSEGAHDESYKVFTQSGEDTGVQLFLSFEPGFDPMKMGEVLRNNSSAYTNQLSSVRLRIIASTNYCVLSTRNVIKIEEADTGKVLYENPSASR